MEGNDTKILFYGRRDPCYEFSNFYPSPILIDSKLWPTTEHYYQAMKFPNDPEFQEKIRLVTDPGKMKALAWGDKSPELRKDWDSVSSEVMFKCCKEKFLQHEALKKVLLGTGDKELIEHTKNDAFWGDGGDGSGRNELGKVLMAVRKEIREMDEKK